MTVVGLMRWTKDNSRKRGLLSAALLSGFMALSLGTPAQVVGLAWAWGSNSYGQLGNGSNTASNVPVQVHTLNVIGIAGGGSHSLALEGDGTVWAWGNNDSGQLGTGGASSYSNLPVQVYDLVGVTAIAAGDSHSLALRADGAVWAWGSDSNGQLGDGTNNSSNVPVKVSSLTGVTAIAAGQFHSLAIKNDGTVWAWGSNSNGQLGDGMGGDSNVPVQVSGLGYATAVAGGGSHSLAIASGGTVWAWGSNSFGQLGNGLGGDSSVPVQVSGLTNAKAIAAGGGYSLALRNDGTVWSWGYNGDGELGNGTYDSSNVPVQVSTLADVAVIAGGYSHCLALEVDATRWVWGSNASGQLGIGTNTANYNLPVQMVNLMGLGVTAMAGGGSHSLAYNSFNSLCPPIALSPAVLPGGTAGTAYGQAITASGGTPPYSFEVTDGALPSGLTLASNGLLSGTIAAVGAYSFTVTATDAGGCSGSQAYSLTVSCHAITLSPAGLPVGMVGTAYNQTITASGGTPPYTFAITSGSLPDGLTPTSGGAISGTPTSVGTSNFTVTATDANSCTGSQAYSVTINSAGCPTISLSPTSAPDGSVGTPYSQTLTAGGGTSPYTFAVTGGALPDGLSPDPDGTIFGTPTAAGTFNFTVTATDALGCSGSQNYAVVISAVPPPAVSSLVKMGSPFRIGVDGGNLQDGIKVYINGSTTEWAQVTWKSAGKVLVKGGASLKAVVPKGTPTSFTFVNPDGGAATVTGWSW